MRTMLKPLVLGACLIASGCSYVHNLRYNLAHEPVLACDARAIKRRNIKLGKQAWNEMIKQYGECFSCDYREGFVDGFADFLTYGGCVGNGGCCASDTCGGGIVTAPTPTGGSCAGGLCGKGGGCGPEYPICPAVPPVKYRRKKYMTPEGCQAIEDWYMGVRHGAATAQASGLRAINVIPIQCPPAFGADDSCDPPAINRPRPPKHKDEAPVMPPPAESVPGTEPAPTPPAGETLPQPRPDAKPVNPPATPPAAPDKP